MINKILRLVTRDVFALIFIDTEVAGTRKRQKLHIKAAKTTMFCHHKISGPDLIILGGPDTRPDPLFSGPD